MMTITLRPSTEVKLLEKARREGQDPDALANDALLLFLETDTQQAASTIPPEQPGEDPRWTVLRAIEERNREMNPKPRSDVRDFLREGRAGGMFERHFGK